MFSGDRMTEKPLILNRILLKMQRFTCTQSTSSSPNRKGCTNFCLAAILPTPTPQQSRGKNPQTQQWALGFPLELMTLSPYSDAFANRL